MTFPGFHQSWSIHSDTEIYGQFLPPACKRETRVRHLQIQYVAIPLCYDPRVNYCVRGREKARKDDIADIVGDGPFCGAAGLACLLIPEYYF